MRPSAPSRRASVAGPSGDRGPELTDWLMAVGGAGAVLATRALIVPAAQHMHHIRERADAAEKQAEAAADQVTLMREASDEDAKRRYIDQKNERANEQRVARRRQADTRARHGRRATRNAARAQLQPIVFAPAHGAPVSIPDDEFDIGERLVAVPFYLTNERRGVALDIDSGIALGRVEYAFGGGMRFPTPRVRGESVPAAGPDATRAPPDATSCPRSLGRQALADARRAREEPVCWCRFGDVFGERFETPEHTPDPRAPRPLRRRAVSCAAPIKPAIVNIPDRDRAGSAASSATSATTRATGVPALGAPGRE